MRYFKFVSFSVLTVFGAVSLLTAKGIFITPGVRAGGMGSSYIAVANDATAVYWNPAGLAQLKDPEAELSAFYIDDNTESNTSLKNVSAPDSKNGDFPFKKILPTEPSEFKSKKMKTAALIPCGAGLIQLKGFTVGAAAYGVGGGGGTWEDKVADITGKDTLAAEVKSKYFFIVGNLSAAKQITEKLYLGLGLDMVNMSDSKDVSKTYTRGTGSAAPVNYSAKIGIDSSGYGLQANAGVIYSIMNNLKAGAVFRSGTTIKMDGEATYVQTGLAALGAAYADVNFKTDFDREYAYPMTYGIGVSYEPVKNLTFACSAERNEYSTMKDDYKYDTPLAGIFANVDAKSGWKDITQLRIGAEYKLNEKISVRGGAYTDPAPYSQSKLTLLDVNQYDIIFGTLGLGYDFGRINVDASYIKGFSDKPSIGARSYEYPLDTFKLGAGYKF